MATGIEERLRRRRGDASGVRHAARGEAERRFATAVVCAQISDALERLLERREREQAPAVVGRV